MQPDTCNTGHAILGGCGHLGSRIAAGLLERGCHVVVIDRDIENALVTHLESLGCTIIRGDIRDEDILAQAGTSSASCFIAATGDDNANLEAAIAARQKNERCTVVTRLYDQTLGERIERVFRIRALSASFMASPAYVSAATDDSVISALTVDGCCLCIHSTPTQQSKMNTCSIAYTDKGLGLSNDSVGNNCFYANVHSSSRNVYSKRSRANKRKKHKRSSVIGPSRLFNELSAMWKHSPIITKNLTIALLAVFVISVAVFWLIGKMSPLDALYFVVTTMTTVGYGDFNLQHAPTGLKVFGVVMMLSGAALLATIYAIIADRVLATRVEYLLGRRRVNLSGHTVVVGLGKVGYRVARDLSNLGLDVVGIESKEDSENVSSAKALFPVIVGDAARTSILNKAAVDVADTILALTDDSLLNLNIALNAREHNPSIGTIVRTYDVGLAEKFVSFGLDKAISTSAIAAPAFVDAAIYPHVKGSFRFCDEDILVARFVVDDRSALIKMSPLDISKKFGVVIVAVADSLSSDYHVFNQNSPLREGQKALVLLTRSALDKLNL